MTKRLQAFVTLLQWQLQTLTEQQQQLLDQLSELGMSYQHHQQQMANASISSPFILPERDIASSYFIQQQHYKLEQLHVRKLALQADINQLAIVKMTIKRRLKQCDKQQIRHLAQQRDRAEVVAQGQLDEWVLQRRGMV